MEGGDVGGGGGACDRVGALMGGRGAARGGGGGAAGGGGAEDGGGGGAEGAGADGLRVPGGTSSQSVEAALSLRLKTPVFGRSRVHQSSANLQLMERMPGS
jgi:hypothetical protein